MASGLIVNATQFDLTGTSGGTVTIPAATSGNKLIIVLAGTALVTSSGFTKKSTYPGTNHLDIALFEKDATGGETSIAITATGNESGVIFECLPGLTFVSAGNPNASNSHHTDTATNTHIQNDNSVTLSTGEGVIFSVFAAETTTTFGETGSGTVKWRQLAPYGTAYDGGNQVATDKFVYRIGVSDVKATESYPPTNSAGVFNVTSVWSEGGDNLYTLNVLYSNTSGVTANEEPNPIVKENTLPGTLSTNWYLGGSATNANIAGYTDKQVYLPGDTVNFNVDSNNVAFTVEIYRTGFYGYDQFGARNVLGNGQHITGTPAIQPSPTVDPDTSMVSCAWDSTASWTIPADACPGVYVFNMVSSTNKACGQFVVEGNLSDSHVVVNPSPTDRAYNLWGARTDHGTDLNTGTWTGFSLYQDGASGATSDFSKRATAVSYDCPLATQSQRDMTFYFDAMHGEVMFMEAQGVNLGYTDEIALEDDEHHLDDATSILPLGHHEYVSTAMYNAYQNARAAGVNALWLSSNTAGWRIRFDDADTNHRNIICYKDSGTRDVDPPDVNSGFDPVTPTGSWRDSHQTNGVDNPDQRFEAALTGQRFVFSGPINQQQQIDAQHKAVPVWRNSAGVQGLVAALAANDFDNGTNGTTITTANSGGSAQENAFDIVSTPTGGGACTFDDTHFIHGSLAFKCQTGTGGSSDVRYTTTIGNKSTIYGRFYFYSTAHPTSNNIRIAQVATAGGSVCAAIYYNTNGTLTVVDSTIGSILTTTNAVNLNGWSRVEFKVVGSATAGHVELKLYKTNATGNTPDDNLSSGNTVNTAGTMGVYSIGMGFDVHASIGPFWFDDIAFSDVGYPNNVYTSGDEDLGYEADVANGLNGEPSNMVKLFQQTIQSTHGANTDGTIYDSDISDIHFGWTVYRFDESGALWGNAGWRGMWMATRRRGTSTFAQSTVDLNFQNAFLCFLADICRVNEFPTLQAMRQDSDAVLTDPTLTGYGSRDAAALAYGLDVPAPSSADTSTAAESGVVLAAVTGSDTSHTTETMASLLVTVTDEDESTMVESSVIGFTISDSDTSTMSEDNLAGVPVSDSDTATMTDSESLNTSPVTRSFVDQDFTCSVKMTTLSGTVKVIAYGDSVSLVSLGDHAVPVALGGTAANDGR